MTQAKLSDKQRLFVDAYVGEARCNATRAALLAGYPASSADKQGWRVRHTPKVAAEIERILADMRDDGITIRRGRVQALEDLFARARGVLEARADHFREINRKIEAGDPDAVLLPKPAPGAETGLLVEVPRAIGAGRNTRLVWEWQFDKSLFSSIQSTLEQVAKEVGEWNEKREVSGPDGKPIEFATITDARQAIAMAIAQELESEGEGEGAQ